MNKQIHQHKIPEDESQSTLSSIFKWLSHLSGAIGFTLSLWCALLSASLIGSSVFIILDIDGYRPTTFVVENLIFSKGHHRGSGTTYGGYYAEGIVDDKIEKFNLGDYVPTVVNSMEDIKKHVQEGQTLDVMYNPDVYKPMLRVQYPEKNFIEKWKNRQKKMINTAYGPYAIFMFFCFLFGIFGGVLKSCIGLFVASTIIITLSWVPTLVELIISFL